MKTSEVCKNQKCDTVPRLPLCYSETIKMADEPKDEDSPIQERGRTVRRRWFSEQTAKKQDEVIEPAFNKEHPTHADKKRATEDYG